MSRYNHDVGPDPDPDIQSRKRWICHAGHEGADAGTFETSRPHLLGPADVDSSGIDSEADGRAIPRNPFDIRRWGTSLERSAQGFFDVSTPTPAPQPRASQRLITIDGSEGEGGGQILRTSLSLSLLTGRPFRIVKIRANRDKPGLRPQHLAAVRAAADLGNAEVVGDAAGSRDLTFRPSEYEARDLSINIGTAGATTLVLQTLHLPLALKLKDDQAVRLTLKGGTFNLKAPSFPFLESSWRLQTAELGAPIALAMPAAGFYPKGGGALEAWIEPARLCRFNRDTRGPLIGLRGVAGVCNLRSEIAQRLKTQAESRLLKAGFDPEIELVQWKGTSQGAAIHLTAVYENIDGKTGASKTSQATFVGLGERGKPSEEVADEAVNEFLAFHEVENAAIDPHTADQILLPLAIAEGRSTYTVSEITDHLRTNVKTINAFLPDRSIKIERATDDGQPPRVIIG